MARSILATQGSPSRQGVHQPHDSWAKKLLRLWTMPTGQVWSSSTIIVPVPSRLPAFSPSEVHRHVQVLLDQEVGRGAAGQQAAEAVARPHAAGVLLEDLAQGVPIGSSHSPGRFTLPLAP
jgi:hypothetical protein